MLWGPLGKHVHGLMFLAGKKKSLCSKNKRVRPKLAVFCFFKIFLNQTFINTKSLQY